MRPVRVAIVGTGFGVRTQLPGFRAAGGFEIVSLTGRDPERTRRLAEAHDVPLALTAIERAITEGDPELVCISTPPHVHHAMALATLAAGRHCLLEKPMAMDAREAAELHAAAGAGGPFALLDHELRAHPTRQEARRRIRAGDLGHPLHAEVRFLSHGRAAHGLTFGWLATRAAGGGMLGAIGSHLLDMLDWWLGDVASVRARLRTSIPELPDAGGRMRRVETDDGADLLLRHESGASASVTITAVASAYEGISWDVHGSEGSLRVTPEGRLLLRARGAADAEDVSVDDGLGDAPLLDGTQWARGFVLLARDLRRAIDEGRPPSHAATFADGVRTQRVIDAARVSHEAGGRETRVSGD